MFSLILNKHKILSILTILLHIYLIKCNPTKYIEQDNTNYQMGSYNYNRQRYYRSSELQSSTTSQLHKFNVKINMKLELFENVAIIGSDISLGNWLPENGILLENNLTDNTMWNGNVKISLNNDIEYRYFIVSYDKFTESTIIRYWENNLLPRKLNYLQNETNDIFGYYTTDNKIEPIKERISRGWLNGQTVLQLKFSHNSFKYNNWKNSTKIGINVKPFKFNENENLINNNDDGSEDDEDFNNLLPTEAIVEVTKLKYNQSKLILQKSNMEIYYFNDDMIIFHITLTKFNNIGYLIKLTESNNDNPDQIPLGYQYILPSDIKNSEGDLILPIISSGNQSIPIGFMNLSYLVINSLKIQNKLNKKLNLYTSFGQYWHPKWLNLDFGHRGLGVSFKYPDEIGPPAPENTIASFKLAGLAGADGVEFDVHLTKDLLPVIYHDFHIYVNFNNEKPKDVSDLNKMYIKDLTYRQLKSLRTYQVLSNNEIVEYPSHNEQQNKDYRLFPLLEELLKEVDPSIGFDVEIKWPQKREDGSVESIQTIDKNLFADRILNVLLEKGCGRMIFMSCFDADLNTMLKFKQNIYPVMFLSVGESKKYQRYLDPRCHSIENAVTNAMAWDLLGAIPYTEDYFRDKELANLANNLGQISFCWGNQANSSMAVKELKKFGLTGVIYDRVDLLLPSDKTKSIFNNDEFKKLFQMQCLKN